MAPEEGNRSIADATRPNAGRIYDYLLGGTHNFEVDRLAAKQIFATMPLLPSVAKLIRWFLGEAIRRLSAEGYRHFLDFASGLPTIDHVHQVAAPGSKVIYSDLDPVTVSYGQELTKDLPNVKYVHCDASNPKSLLDSGVVEQVFGNNKKVAIGYNGILYFLSDEQIASAMRTLYDWAGAGSKVYLCTEDTTSQAGGTDARLTDFAEQYKKIGQPYFSRSLDKLAELVRPWKLVNPGFKVLEEWIDMDKLVNREVKTEWGGGVYGAFFSK